MRRRRRWATLSAAVVAAAVTFTALSSSPARADSGALWHDWVGLGARIQVDAAVADADTDELESGSEIRRARLKLRGRPSKRLRYNIEYDFREGGEIRPIDVWLRFDPTEHLSLRVGHQYPPFALEQLTSSDNITFMERALSSALTPDYHVGAVLTRNSARSSLSLAVTGAGASSLRDFDDAVSAGRGLTVRYALAPVATDDRTLHVGAAAEYRKTEDGTVRFRSRPESRVVAGRLVDTRSIEQADHVVTFGVESAYVKGRFSVQGEYVQARTARMGLPDLDFAGWYVYGSWFPTDGSRRYSVSEGRFRSVSARTSRRAWELALRFSRLDLSDRDVTGGVEQNLTVGANWYLSPRVRLMWNLIRANAEPSANGEKELAYIAQMRVQYRF